MSQGDDEVPIGTKVRKRNFEVKFKPNSSEHDLLKSENPNMDKLVVQELNNFSVKISYSEDEGDTEDENPNNSSDQKIARKKPKGPKATKKPNASGPVDKNKRKKKRKKPKTNEGEESQYESYYETDVEDSRNGNDIAGLSMQVQVTSPKNKLPIPNMSVNNNTSNTSNNSSESATKIERRRKKKENKNESGGGSDEKVRTTQAGSIASFYESAYETDASGYESTAENNGTGEKKKRKKKKKVKSADGGGGSSSQVHSVGMTSLYESANESEYETDTGANNGEPKKKKKKKKPHTTDTPTPADNSSSFKSKPGFVLPASTNDDRGASMMSGHTTATGYSSEASVHSTQSNQSNNANSKARREARKKKRKQMKNNTPSAEEHLAAKAEKALKSPRPKLAAANVALQTKAQRNGSFEGSSPNTTTSSENVAGRSSKGSKGSKEKSKKKPKIQTQQSDLSASAVPPQSPSQKPPMLAQMEPQLSDPNVLNSVKASSTEAQQPQAQSAKKKAFFGFISAGKAIGMNPAGNRLATGTGVARAYPIKEMEQMSLKPPPNQKTFSKESVRDKDL